MATSDDKREAGVRVFSKKYLIPNLEKGLAHEKDPGVVVCALLHMVALINTQVYQDRDPVKEMEKLLQAFLDDYRGQFVS